jgi:hypothetical protein
MKNGIDEWLAKTGITDWLSRSPPQPRVIAKLKDGREYSFHFKTQRLALEFIETLDRCPDVESREMQIGRQMEAPAWFSGPAKLIADNNPVTSTKH